MDKEYDSELAAEQYGVMLANIRDMFPVPPIGSALEQDWAGAMGVVECIPAYVEAWLSAIAKEVYEHPEEEAIRKKEEGRTGPFRDKVLTKLFTGNIGYRV